MARTFQKLTRPAMRKLAAGEKINEHGIAFERQPNGDGLFTVNVMVDGQRIGAAPTSQWRTCFIAACRYFAVSSRHTTSCFRSWN